MAPRVDGAAALHVDIDAPAPLVPAGAPRQRETEQACGTLTWSALTVTVTDAKGHSREILKRALGVVQPGELCAILGPSGCGKRCVRSRTSA